MGVVSCHNMLMLLAVSKEFTDPERDVVIPLMMKGFQVSSNTWLPAEYQNVEPTVNLLFKNLKSSIVNP